MLKLIVGLAALVSVAYAGDLFPIANLQQCDDQTSVKSVEVENCKNSEQCELTKGSDHLIKVKYVAPKDVEVVKVLITGLVGGAELPFPGLQRYICKTPGNENFCPQKAGQEYTASITLPILSVFPKIETTAFVRFIDDNAKSEDEEKLACFQMKVKLVDDPNAAKQETQDNQEDDE